jgi:hypothetical protein
MQFIADGRLSVTRSVSWAGKEILVSLSGGGGELNVGKAEDILGVVFWLDFDERRKLSTGQAVRVRMYELNAGSEREPDIWVNWYSNRTVVFCREACEAAFSFILGR